MTALQFPFYDIVEIVTKSCEKAPKMGLSLFLLTVGNYLFTFDIIKRQIVFTFSITVSILRCIMKIQIIIMH